MSTFNIFITEMLKGKLESKTWHIHMEVQICYVHCLLCIKCHLLLTKKFPRISSIFFLVFKGNVFAFVFIMKEWYKKIGHQGEHTCIAWQRVNRLFILLEENGVCGVNVRPFYSNSQKKKYELNVEQECKCRT